MLWADAFAIPNDGQNVVFTKPDYDYLVGQGILPAAAGTVIVVSQPELYPVIGTVIVIVGIAYFGYKTAQAVARAMQNSKVKPLNIRDVCMDQLVKCLESPWQKDTGYGSRKDCSACFRECVNAGGSWPFYKCQP
jgi:hypothetical protein